MYPAASSEEELLAIHEALIEGCQAELALACDPRALTGVALVVLPHGSPVAQVAFGSRAEWPASSPSSRRKKGRQP